MHSVWRELCQAHNWVSQEDRWGIPSMIRLGTKHLFLSLWLRTSPLCWTGFCVSPSPHLNPIFGYVRLEARSRGLSSCCVFEERRYPFQESVPVSVPPPVLTDPNPSLQDSLCQTLLFYLYGPDRGKVYRVSSKENYSFHKRLPRPLQDQNGRGEKLVTNPPPNRSFTSDTSLLFSFP